LKLPLDTCVSPRTRDTLAAQGHDVVWTGDWNADPGDRAIMEAALREGRILFTLDKDFGALAVAFGQPHCGIVRLVDLDPALQAAACGHVLARHAQELLGGAIATVTKERVRLRPASADSSGGP
jgi:predicted nuclease of predicted toxin-antitoxin system